MINGNGTTGGYKIDLQRRIKWMTLRTGFMYADVHERGFKVERRT
jgi:hypothetical protein